MRSHPARIFVLVIALVVPAVLAACGSSSSSSSSEDPQQVLHDTFNNDTKVTSANLNISLSVDAYGSQSGNFTGSIDGPFQSEGTTSFPELDLTAKVAGSGAGQSVNFEGALTATKDAAFVTYKDQAYEVPSATFQQFKSAYEAQAQAAGGSGSSSNASSVLQQLGIDPSTWLTNVSNEGTTDVEGESTIHISGDADVSKILTDLSKVAQNVPGAATQGIDPSQLQQFSSLVKDAHIDVYSGADDKVLRKLAVSMDIQPPAAAAGGVDDLKIDFAITLSDVNNPQTITAPTDTKPLSDLMQQLGAGGILGQLGGTSGLPSTGGSSGGPSSSTQAKYTECVAKAAQSNDPQAANKCLALLQ